MSDKSRTVTPLSDARELSHDSGEPDESTDAHGTRQVDLSASTWTQLHELREQGESMDETIARLFENAQDNRVLFSKFGVLAVLCALAWLGSFAIAGAAVSNVVAGAYITLTLSWIILREVAFRGLVGTNAE